MAYEKIVNVSRKLSENYEYIKNKIGLDESFDVGYREMLLSKTKIHLYYTTGLVDTKFVLELMEELLKLNDGDLPQRKAFEIIHNHIIFQQVTITDDMGKIITDVLSGLLGIIVDGENKGFIIDLRSYPGRGPSEPETEKVVRGSRDGYTENIIINTALTRRRLRDPNLRMEIMQIGRNSKTDVCITYIKGIADDKVVDDVRNRLKSVNADELVMSDKKLEELIARQRFNPYPRVRYTERPDILAIHLTHGLIGIMVDTSPSVMIVPTTYFDQLQHVEEYRQTPVVGSFLRSARTLGVIGSIFLVPIWLLFVLHPEYLPKELAFIGPTETGNVPIIWQVLIAEVGIEFLRMAAVHTPTALSTAMGIVAGILVGQIAVDVGLFTPEVVLYVAVSSLGAYATPSYELSLANKMYKLLLIILTAIFGLWGLVGGFIFNTLFLTFSNSFGKPYFFPVLPFNFKEFLNIFIRFDQPAKKNRNEN
jgi:stage V sporulation protein AF